jgi:hypothetical protein
MAAPTPAEQPFWLDWRDMKKPAEILSALNNLLIDLDNNREIPMHLRGSMANGAKIRHFDDQGELVGSGSKKMFAWVTGQEDHQAH